MILAIFLFLSELTHLRNSNPRYKHSRGSPEVPNQNLRQIGPGVQELWLDKQKNRHTDYDFIYIDTLPEIVQKVVCTGLNAVNK